MKTKIKILALLATFSVSTSFVMGLSMSTDESGLSACRDKMDNDGDGLMPFSESI